MINWKTIVHIPSKKVLEDLALREGEPTQDSMCQIRGMADILKKYARDEPLESVYLRLIKKDDIRADKCNEEARVRFESINGRPMKTIYDIGEAVIRDYIGNLVFSATRHNEGSIKEDRRNFQYGRNFEDSEDEDFVIQESDIQTKKDGPSTRDRIYWNKKLPYLLKKLHQISKSIEISIISSLVAYTKARREYNSNNRTKETIPIGKIIERGVMKIGKDGKIKRTDTGRIIYEEDGKGNFREYVYDYIIGTRKGELYDLIHELLYIVNELGIDLAQEKAELYEEDFINDLITTYVTSNRAYLNMKCNPSSLKAIRNISFDRTEDKKERKMSKRELIIKMINRQMSLFENADDATIEKYRDTSGTYLKDFINFMLNIDYDFYSKFLYDLYFNNGFVCDSNSNPVLFPVSLFRRYNTDECFLLHKDGYMVLVASLRDNITNTVLVWYPIRLALAWLRDINLYCESKDIGLYELKRHYQEICKFLESKHYEKKKFGVWLETVV